jgi:hypothetical protein
LGLLSPAVLKALIDSYQHLETYGLFGSAGSGLGAVAAHLLAEGQAFLHVLPSWA